MTDKVTLASIASFQNDTTAVAQYNANNAAITTAMDNTLSRDGTGPNQMAAPIDMNSNQIINLPSPVSLNSPVRLTDLNASIAGGTINAIPAGGNAGTVLIKNSSTNYDVSWSTQPGDNTAGSNITLSGTNPVTIATTLTPVFNSVQTPTLINTGTLTLPTSTDTLVGRATTDTLTNKTIPSIVGGSAAGSNVTITSTSSGSPSGDFVNIIGSQINVSSPTGGGTTTIFLGSPGTQSAVVGFSGSGSGNTNLKASAGASGTLTLPAATDTLVGRATTDTLTNKTLSSPTFTGTPSGLTITQINQCPALRLTAAGINFNALNTDTTFPVVLPSGFVNYEIREVIVSNASAAIGTAQFGIFSQSGGLGTVILPATICTISTTAANTNGNYQLATVTNFSTVCYNFSNLFFRITTAQGTAVTATVSFLIYPIS